jgi:hypothetical protein
MVDFITQTVGCEYAGRYDALSYEVVKLWTNADEKEEANQRLGTVLLRNCANP